MRYQKLILIITTLWVFFYASAKTANSQGPTPSTMVNLRDVINNVGVGSNLPNLTTFGDILTALLPYAYGMAGFGLLFYLIRCGFQYLTSAGDPKKIEAAKQCLTMSIMGFVVIVTAFWVTQILNYIFKLESPFI